MTRAWQTGNAAVDSTETRGWLVGHFIDPAHGVRSTSDVELKWAHHPRGDQRAEWSSDEQRTTLVILIEGNFRVKLADGAATLAGQGDYVMWGPGIDHTWEALDDSVVLTVRWPSNSS